MSELKVFDRWGVEGIKVQDPGIVDYINLDPKIVPRSGARYAAFRFHKSSAFIVERLINKMMNTGHKSKKHFKSSYGFTGKGNKAYSIVEKAFEIIEKKMKMNPIAVLVAAIENAAPREEVIAIEYGGARYPKAVECAPQRRIDIALRLMTQGAYHKSFNSKRTIESTLSDEIIAAYNLSNTSNAIGKKLELERQADASR